MIDKYILNWKNKNTKQNKNMTKSVNKGSVLMLYAEPKWNFFRSFFPVTVVDIQLTKCETKLFHLACFSVFFPVTVVDMQFTECETKLFHLACFSVTATEPTTSGTQKAITPVEQVLKSMYIMCNVVLYTSYHGNKQLRFLLVLCSANDFFLLHLYS